jgi:hypothetical protein
MLSGTPVDGQVEVAPGVRQPRVPIWIAGRTGFRAGPRRVARHGLEGLALVNAESWTPDHVGDGLAAGGLIAGSVDVILVGGVHPDPAALGAAGATWCMPEILPGATASDALARASSPPG